MLLALLPHSVLILQHLPLVSRAWFGYPVSLFLSSLCEQLNLQNFSLAFPKVGAASLQSALLPFLLFPLQAALLLPLLRHRFRASLISGEPRATWTGSAAENDFALVILNAAQTSLSTWTGSAAEELTWNSSVVEGLTWNDSAVVGRTWNGCAVEGLT